MNLKRVFVAAICAAGLLISGCGGGTDSSAENKTVKIWTSGEDYRNEYYLTECQKKFPDYNITLEYMNTSNIAAKVLEEGDKADCDIILSEEYGYLEKCEDNLAELADFDFAPFLDDIVPASHKYSPEYKNSGCIVINRAILEKNNLPVPTSYQDLLDPRYKNLISMPSPASSGTGYMFLRQLVNEWGEDAAFDYFAKLTENILQYTSSGSGPVNALVQGEVAIGLGMTGQAVFEINQGVPLEIIFFAEGSPFSMYGNAILKKSYDRQAVRDVFNYLATDLCKGNNEKFFPDQIFKDFAPTIKNYPTNIHYGNMKNDTLAEKERLLKRWTFS